MSAALKRTPISVDEYLASELDSPIKHEYLCSVVYAMEGARNQHNRISGNVFGKWYSRLSGIPCQPWNSDTKIPMEFT
jgi:Uma2 family endonuclease